MLRLSLAALGVALAASVAGAAAATPEARRNVILFVADGLRSQIVTPQTAPTMAELRRRGVDFRNSHALYPTVTTANASAFATGHGLGDTGDFGNSLYMGFPLASLHGSPIAVMENDAVLAELAGHWGGSYLNEETVLAAARRAGFSTAAVGKLGPIAVQGLGSGADQTIVIDDASGTAKGVALAPEIQTALAGAGLSLPTPGRGENAAVGSAKVAGTTSANVEQGAWFAHVASQVLLPRFKSAHRPFALVFWSRDPDGTQHNQGDSLGRLVPGINGPTSLAAIRNADAALAELLAALKRLGLDKTTDVIVTADHGFSTISKESRTSRAAAVDYADIPHGQLPPGFLAIDLSSSLDLPLSTIAGEPIQWREGRHAAWGDGLLGDPQHPEIVVAANGGSDLLYLPRGAEHRRVQEIVDALWSQDYTAAVFVKDGLGRFGGALPLSAVGLVGAALTPTPDVVVSFRSFSTGCAEPELCTAEVGDTSLQQGQGNHGSLSRANTHNFMAAQGPDFKQGFVDPAPTSNADVARTLFALLKLQPRQTGDLAGRVLSESLRGGRPVRSSRFVQDGEPDAQGRRERLVGQRVGAERYFDAAGAPGRAVGVPAR